jgi:putative ABC transport system ATP-binding protein
VAVTSLYREPERDEIEWPALEFHDVFRIYRSGPVETVALRGVDLRVERGEFVAIWGPSGSGKSTLLHLAAGLDQPSAGEVRAFGKSLSRMDETELADHRARGVAIVFQADNLWSDLSLVENVALGVRLAGLEAAESIASSVLPAFGLEARGSHRAAALSGGEQQRAAIAAAAARHAPLVLADEPTGELDERHEDLVLSSLFRLRHRERHGTALVVVTHSQRVASKADRVVELRDGRVVA